MSEPPRVERIKKNKDEGAVFPGSQVSPVSPVSETKETPETKETGNTYLEKNFLQSLPTQKHQLAMFYYSRGVDGGTIQEISNDSGIDYHVIKTSRAREPLKSWLSKKGDNREALNAVGRAAVEKLFIEWKKATTDDEIRAHDIRESTPSFSPLDLDGQVEIWRTFFEDRPETLREQVVCVDFRELARHDPVLADMLLDEPEDVLKAGEIALEHLPRPDELTDEEGNVVRQRVSVHGLPQDVSVSHLKGVHINKLVQVRADVVAMSKRRPLVVSCTFECPSCGNILPVMQLSDKMAEPSRCSCGRKGKFKLLNKTLVDSFRAVLKQPLDELLGSKAQPADVNALFVSHNAGDNVYGKMGPTSQVRVVAILHDVPEALKNGGQSTTMNLLLKVVSVELLDEQRVNVTFTDDEERAFQQAVSDHNHLHKLVQSCFPGHVGEEEMKIALALLLLAKPFHEATEPAQRAARHENLHVGIMGDPSMGKSRLDARLAVLAPIYGRALGPGASGPGLALASDAKNEFTEMRIPMPGKLPKSHRGIFTLDEIDKMEVSHQLCMNEVLTERRITVTKAGIDVSLPANVTVLTLGNARSASWTCDSITDLSTEFNVHHSLLTRELWFFQRDDENKERDAEIARRVLNGPDKQHYTDEFLRRFIVKARSSCYPSLRKEEADRIVDLYASLRHNLEAKSAKPRFVEQLRALTLLIAKAHLREETTQEDLEQATRIVGVSYRSYGYDNSKLDRVWPK